MYTRISIPSFLTISFVLLLTGGCKIEITVPKGGKVVSGSHAYDCNSGENCVVEVNDFHFSERFYARAWEGWAFVGWKLGRGHLCQDIESVCHLSTRGLGKYEAISAIVESDETLFLEPEFVEGTPFYEALATVQDEGLRHCLSKVPAPRRYAEQVSSVDCERLIGSVQGIEAFPFIERLTLRGNGSVTDLQPLGKLSRLQNLELYLRSPHFNADALGELELLNDLTLYFIIGTSPDLTGIGNLQSLRRLTLASLGPMDIKELASLVNLRDLKIRDSQIRDIGPLTELTKLKYLSMERTQISDIGPLTGMTKMKTLDIRGNQIIDITPLAGMTKLELLDLTSNQISDIGPLAGLNKLETLYLRYNQISDISLLAGLNKLETLHLGYNQISDISPLAGLNNLESLELANNEINDIGPLAEIDSIPRLYLQNNLIHDASPLRQHFPLTLDPNFGPGIDFDYHRGIISGFMPAPLGISLDLSNNPIVRLGDTLDGVRAGGIFLLNVPLICQEYPRLVMQYDSRAIITDRADVGVGYDYFTYKLPERCK